MYKLLIFFFPSHVPSPLVCPQCSGSRTVCRTVCRTGGRTRGRANIGRAYRNHYSLTKVEILKNTLLLYIFFYYSMFNMCMKMSTIFIFNKQNIKSFKYLNQVCHPWPKKVEILKNTLLLYISGVTILLLSLLVPTPLCPVHTI